MCRCRSGGASATRSTARAAMQGHRNHATCRPLRDGRERLRTSRATNATGRGGAEHDGGKRRHGGPGHGGAGAPGSVEGDAAVIASATGHDRGAAGGQHRKTRHTARRARQPRKAAADMPQSSVATRAERQLGCRLVGQEQQVPGGHQCEQGAVGDGACVVDVLGFASEGEGDGLGRLGAGQVEGRVPGQSEGDGEQGDERQACREPVSSQGESSITARAPRPCGRGAASTGTRPSVGWSQAVRPGPSLSRCPPS